MQENPERKLEKIDRDEGVPRQFNEVNRLPVAMRQGTVPSGTTNNRGKHENSERSKSDERKIDSDQESITESEDDFSEGEGSQYGGSSGEEETNLEGNR